MSDVRKRSWTRDIFIILQDIPGIGHGYQDVCLGRVAKNHTVDCFFILGIMGRHRPRSNLG